jgi:hypothetical protein
MNETAHRPSLLEEIFPLVLAAGKAYLERENAMARLTAAPTAGAAQAAHRPRRPPRGQAHGPAPPSRKPRKTLPPPSVSAESCPGPAAEERADGHARSGELAYSPPLPAAARVPFPTGSGALHHDAGAAPAGYGEFREETQTWHQAREALCHDTRRPPYGPLRRARRNLRWVPSPVQGQPAHPGRAASGSCEEGSAPLRFADLCRRLREL